MTSTSRTGLVSTPKKKLAYIKKHDDINNRLPPKFETIPMALSLRPLGGLYNPFPKGCSVLCNHPAPTGYNVKDLIHQIKSTLTIEGKNVQHLKNNNEETTKLHGTDNIPEDLFRRYTDTDSRPHTPSSPTPSSLRTRNSNTSFLNRRCITPELGKHEIIKRKKIILDLRRTHSQETLLLHWKPSSDLSQSGTDDVECLKPKTKSAGANEDKKPKRQKSEEQRPKSSLNIATIAEEGVEDAKKLPQTCINEHDFGDEDVRRGKKRKKIKLPAATTTFHLSEDPETQVATLGPDSLNPSTRPSLIPNATSLLPNKDKSENEPVLLKGSFLTDDAFQALKTELDIDVIENTFERYLNRALREAIKYMPPKVKVVTKAKEEVEETPFVAQQKMPRKFSKSATRFEVPLNLKALETMSVLTYLSKYVWVARQRKQLYKRVFLKYLNKIEESETKASSQVAEFSDINPDEIKPLEFSCNNEYVERTMTMQMLPQALEDVLEFHGTKQNIAEMLRLLDYENMKGVNLSFRAWCGIVSFAERLALKDPTCTDSCDELEKADFNSMEERLEFFKVPENLRQVFDIIRGTHNLKY